MKHIVTDGIPDARRNGAKLSQFELEATFVRLQANRLVRLYAVNAAMAETLAPLVFLEAMR